MLELGIDETTFRPLESFKNAKFGVGMKPMICFTGSLFDSTPEYKLVKSVFLDFFRGETVNAVDVEGLQYMINVSAAEPSDKETAPVVHLRVHLIKTRKSGQKLPRVEVEEIGPRMDFKVRRIQEADAGMMKEALKKPRQLEVCFFFNHLRYFRFWLVFLWIADVVHRRGRGRILRPTSSATSLGGSTLGSRI